MEELVREGFLREAPVEPFGGRYVLEPGTGAVSSTSGKGRLKVHRPRTGGI